MGWVADGSANNNNHQPHVGDVEAWRGHGNVELCALLHQQRLAEAGAMHKLKREVWGDKGRG